MLEFIMTQFAALTATCTSIFAWIGAGWNGEVASIIAVACLFIMAIRKWDNDPTIPFKAYELFMTNGHEDLSKMIHGMWAFVLAWGFILMAKSNNLNWPELILFIGFAFGPTMFNAILRTAALIKGVTPTSKLDDTAKPKPESQAK